MFYFKILVISVIFYKIYFRILVLYCFYFKYKINNKKFEFKNFYFKFLLFGDILFNLIIFFLTLYQIMPFMFLINFCLLLLLKIIEMIYGWIF
jgi:hypothetical protein